MAYTYKLVVLIDHSGRHEWVFWWAVFEINCRHLVVMGNPAPSWNINYCDNKIAERKSFLSYLLIILELLIFHGFPLNQSMFVYKMCILNSYYKYAQSTLNACKHLHSRYNSTHLDYYAQWIGVRLEIVPN